MNILMIGHSRSGKTSYMAGLYKQYGDKKDGIGIWTSNSSKRAKLATIANNISKGIYPSGTDISSEYNFWLQINDKLIIPFNWYDYRGGALTENSKNSKDAEKLIERIEKADALIIFLDGEKIVSETDDELEDDYEILMWAIQKAMVNKHIDNYFPISFVITKGDMYSDYSPLYNSDGLRFFMPLFENIKTGDTAAGMISVCEVAKSGIYNVFPPLLFSLYYGMPDYIQRQMSEYNSEIESCNRRIEQLNELIPTYTGHALVSIWNALTDDNHQSQLDKHREMKKIIEKQIEELQEKENKLSYLDSLKDDMKEALDSFVEKDIIIAF